MKKIKNRIENNRSWIDDQNLPVGHSKRFEALLEQASSKDEKNKSRVIKKQIFTYVSIAAALLLVVGITIRYYPSTSDPKEIFVQQQEIQGDSLSEEFIETDQYFTQQMNKEIEEIKCKLPYTDKNNREQLINDIEELLKNNESFVAEIKQTQDQELAINYLVLHYRTNIESLEFINEKLGKYIKC